MARNRLRFAIWACVFGAATLAIGIGVATGAKLKTKSASTTLSPEELDSVTAKCKKGTKAVSGGFQSDSNPSVPSGSYIFPYMSRAEGGRKWTSAGLNSANPGELTSFAYCRDQKIKRRSSETTLSEAETNTLTARCPSGTKVASGGFENPDFGAGGGGMTAIVPSESLKTGKRDWSVSGKNLGDISGELATQVNCQKGQGLKTFAEELSIGIGIRDVQAECAGGRRVVSGGFDYSIEPTEVAFVIASHKAGKRTWEVEAMNFEDPTAALTAYAYCEKKKKKKG
jgi:hypothetical protein